MMISITPKTRAAKFTQVVFPLKGRKMPRMARIPRMMLRIRLGIIIFIFVSTLFSLPAFAETTPWAKTPPTFDENLYLIYEAASKAERLGTGTSPAGNARAAYDSYSIILAELKNSTFLDDTPLKTRVLYRRGLLGYKMGDTAAAFADFDQILSDYRQCEMADRVAFQLARDAENRYDYVKAIEYYRMIVEQRVGQGTSRLLPASYWAWVRCANHCNDTSTAQRLCRELIQNCPTSPEAEAAKTLLESRQ